MPQFCDVALPVPLETLFTYRLHADSREPAVGSRVLVPFRNQRMVGIIIALHDAPPKVEAKNILEVLDSEPAVDSHLLKLGQWIAQYYVAPVGEVFRSMLPLAADVKRAYSCTITELGREELHRSATVGSSLRSKKSPEEQRAELQVLDYLASRHAARESTLRATKASPTVLSNLLRKKWIAREDVSGKRDANRVSQKSQKRKGEHSELSDFPLSVSRENQKLETRNSKLTLSSAQNSALHKILAAVNARKFHVALVHGITGSGKTAIYLAAMRSVLEYGKSALLLVPEIGLTPAAAANLHNLFGDAVAILHSALSDSERAREWRRIHSGGARVVVGTRSAIFAPLQNLALIVVDEEHDGSYKQEETPRYHGRDVAVMRGKLENATVVLGSATPSLESYQNAVNGKYELIELRERVEKRPLPKVEIVDMRAEFQQTGEEKIFSRQLASEVRDRLQRGEQAMILLNRRGYSPVALCRACGETVQCRDCAIALTYHKRANALVCHYCGYKQAAPKLCPQCGSEYLFFLGTGSEKLEERLHAEFPQARIGRLDRDTVRRREDFDGVLRRFHAGEIDLLTGTQMIAKGHDVHGVTFVGVVGADFALGFPDFRAAERTFQLLTQMAGRAGRGSTPGTVILQTYFPEHYSIQFAAQHDYAGFMEKELRYRKWMNYPPFTAVANVLVRSDKLEQALKFAGVLGDWFEKNKMKNMRVMGPAAAPILRLKRDYRYHFIIKSESREHLNGTLRSMIAHATQQKIPRTNVVVDVDPVSMT